METKLFSNVVMVNADMEDVKEILSNPQQLLQWVPDISTVDQSEDGFLIKRSGAAINQSERIRIQTNGSKIIYISTQGRLEYKLIFSLHAQNHQAVVQEDLYILKDTTNQLPVKLLAPIAKHAFYSNLIRLGSFAELIATDNQ